LLAAAPGKLERPERIEAVGAIRAGCHPRVERIRRRRDVSGSRGIPVFPRATADRTEGK